jgi:hypothetical protein
MRREQYAGWFRERFDPDARRNQIRLRGLVEG